MGQYYVAINLDKKERWEPGAGLKLMENAWKDYESAMEFNSLFQHEWKGDRVVYVGDYAEDILTYQDHRPADLCKFVKEVGAELESNWIYDYACKLPLTTPAIPKEDYHYLVNHKTREFFDLKEFDEGEWYNDWRTGDPFKNIYDPLMLMLAVGNGLGGGDYNGEGKQFIGSWASTSNFVEFTDDLPVGYKIADFCLYC